MSVNLLGLSRSQFEALCADMGEKPFRARQVMRWMHRDYAGDFAAMSDVSREFRAQTFRDRMYCRPCSAA